MLYHSNIKANITKLDLLYSHLHVVRYSKRENKWRTDILLSLNCSNFGCHMLY